MKVLKPVVLRAKPDMTVYDNGTTIQLTLYLKP